MDEIPASLAIAQAAKETGWGTSRFALEGNALFGQWTWSEAGIKPASADSSSTHKVMRFNELKLSVRAYQRNLNTHSSYKDFRTVRAVLRDNKKKLNSLMLADYLDKYAETGDEYIKILKKIIKQNNLQDFDDSNLMPSSLQLKSLIELSSLHPIYFPAVNKESFQEFITNYKKNYKHVFLYVYQKHDIPILSI